ncbi:MAG TPA: hypothetical protein VK766_05645, partial [Cytophagaceae bacterium]|nr:hypothetical protein [Cytophagaceae bacterium]
EEYLVSACYRMSKTGEVSKIQITNDAGKFDNFSSSAFDSFTKKYATLEITYKYNPNTMGISYEGRIVWSILE